MELVQKNLTSRKTGKPFTAYVLKVGEFESPIFFPSKIEIQYINNHLSGDFDDGGLLEHD